MPTQPWSYTTRECIGTLSSLNLRLEIDFLHALRSQCPIQLREFALLQRIPIGYQRTESGACLLVQSVCRRWGRAIGTVYHSVDRAQVSQHCSYTRCGGGCIPRSRNAENLVRCA